jgi:hypothetical protein
MKVRVYPLTISQSDYYFEHYFEPNYSPNGDLAGYTYNTTGWYGSEIFKRDLKDGIVKIIENLKPKQELNKFSLL